MWVFNLGDIFWVILGVVADISHICTPAKVSNIVACIAGNDNCMQWWHKQWEELPDGKLWGFLMVCIRYTRNLDWLKALNMSINRWSFAFSQREPNHNFIAQTSINKFSIIALSLNGWFNWSKKVRKVAVSKSSYFSSRQYFSWLLRLAAKALPFLGDYTTSDAG